MPLVKRVWLASLILTILLFIDDVSGVDTENADGLVTANHGLISGSLSWPLLAFFSSAFLLTSIVWVVATAKKKHK